MVVNAVGDGQAALPSISTKWVRGEKLQPRTIPVDVIFDLNRMNMTYFPHFPRVQQEMLPTKTRTKNQDEVIQAFSERARRSRKPIAVSVAAPAMPATHCYLVCPEPCIARPERSNGMYKILVDYCKGCRVCIEECPTGCLEGVP